MTMFRTRGPFFTLALLAVIIQASLPLWHRPAIQASPFPWPFVLCTPDGFKVLATPATPTDASSPSGKPSKSFPGVCPVCAAASHLKGTPPSAPEIPLAVVESISNTPTASVGAPATAAAQPNSIRAPPSLRA
jgi:hypothetical protein